MFWQRRDPYPLPTSLGATNPSPSALNVTKHHPSLRATARLHGDLQTVEKPTRKQKNPNMAQSPIKNLTYFKTQKPSRQDKDVPSQPTAPPSRKAAVEGGAPHPEPRSCGEGAGQWPPLRTLSWLSCSAWRGAGGRWGRRTPGSAAVPTPPRPPPRPASAPGNSRESSTPGIAQIGHCAQAEEGAGRSPKGAAPLPPPAKKKYGLALTARPANPGRTNGGKRGLRWGGRKENCKKKK